MEKLYTEKEAADILRMDVASLRRARYNGAIVCHKLSKRSIVFTEQQITDFLKSRERKSCPKSGGNPDLSGSVAPPTGILNAGMPEVKDVSAHLRGVALARKMMQPNKSLPHLSLSGRTPPGQQGNY